MVGREPTFTTPPTDPTDPSDGARVETEVAEIDFSNWQELIDDAFENEDYEVIKNVRRVNPDLSPSKEVADLKIDQILSEEIVNDVFLGETIGMCGLDVTEHEGFTQYVSTQIATANPEDFIDLSILLEESEYVPDADEIRGKYYELLSDPERTDATPTVEFIAKISEITGIQPEEEGLSEIFTVETATNIAEVAAAYDVSIPAETVRSAGEVYFEENGYVSAHLIYEFNDLPPEEDVQSSYKNLLEKGEYEVMWNIRDSTSIIADFAQEDLEPIYGRILSKKYKDEDASNLFFLMEVSDQKPDEEKILKFIRLKAEEGSRKDFSQLENFINTVSDYYELDDEFVRTLFRDAVDSGDFRRLIQLGQLFNERIPLLEADAAFSLLKNSLDFAHTEEVGQLLSLFKATFSQIETDLDNLSSEEVSELVNKSLQNGNISRYKQLRSNTTFEVNQDLLQENLSAYLAGVAREIRDIPDQLDKARDFVEENDLEVSDEVVTATYEAIFQGDYNADDIVDFAKFLEAQIPDELIDTAYGSLLTSECDDPYRAFLIIRDHANGRLPKFSQAEIQTLYERVLGKDQIFSEEFVSLTNILGVAPNFDPEFVMEEYHSAIYSNNLAKFPRINEITGISYVITPNSEKMVRALQDAGLKEMAGDPDVRLTSSLRDLKKVIKLTGVKPSQKAVQDAYHSLLLDPNKHWYSDIKAIEEVTGVIPELPEEVVDEVKRLFLNNPDSWFHPHLKVPHLQNLNSLAPLQFSQEEVLAAYELFTQRNFTLMSRTNWLRMYQDLYDVSGIRPTDSQLRTLFDNVRVDPHLIEEPIPDDSSIKCRSSQALSALRSTFNVPFEGEFQRQVIGSLIFENEFADIKALIDEYNLNVEEIIGVQTRVILENKTYTTIQNMRIALGLERMPFNREIVRGMYDNLIDVSNFWGIEASETPADYFTDLHGNSDITAEMDDDKFFEIYENQRRFELGEYNPENPIDYSIEVLFRNALEEAYGKEIPVKILEDQLLYWLDGQYPSSEENKIRAMESHYGFKVTPEIARKAFNLQVEYLINVSSDDQDWNDFQEKRGKRKPLPPHFVPLWVDEFATPIEVFKNNIQFIESISGELYSPSTQEFDHILISINNLTTEGKAAWQTYEFLQYAEETFGYTPSEEILSQIYARNAAFENTAGLFPLSKQEPDPVTFTTWLRSKYNFEPTEESMQLAYAHSIFSMELVQMDRNLSAVMTLQSSPPNISKIEAAAKKYDLLDEDAKLPDTMQQLYAEHILRNQAESIPTIEEALKVPFELTEAQLQLLYGRLIIADRNELKLRSNISRNIEFLRKRTGVAPHPDIIDARYDLLLENDSWSVDTYTITQSIFEREIPPKLVKKAIARNLEKADFERVLQLVSAFGPNREYYTNEEIEMFESHIDKLVELHWERRQHSGYVDQEKVLVEILELSERLNLKRGSLRKEIMNLCGLEELVPGYDFLFHNKNFVTTVLHFEGMLLNKDEASLIMEDDDEVIGRLHSYQQEIRKYIPDLNTAELMKRAGFDFSKGFQSDDDFKLLEYVLVSNHPEWIQSEAVTERFRDGVKVFGHKNMFSYVTKPGVSYHDALHAFQDIIALQERSGLSPADFFGRILNQVSMDNAVYPEGPSHQHLNTIARTMDKDFSIASILDLAERYKDVLPLVSERVATLDSEEKVFRSWKDLVKFGELDYYLKQRETLDKLVELQGEGRDDLVRYVTTLAFHPDSRVTMSHVMDLVEDPLKYLRAVSSHTPKEVHDAKKPSNYVEMPNLDLTAPQMVEALVDGSLDTLQVITPMEIRYKLPAESPRDLIYRAIGKRKENISGLARNPRVLFKHLNALFAQFDSEPDPLVRYLLGAPAPDGLTMERLEEVIYNTQSGLANRYDDEIEIIVQIGQKSDPIVALAGNDISNCMPFGDGKNTLYNFNVNTSQMVVRVVRHGVDQDGNPIERKRTFSQSLLTKDIDIGVPVPDIIAEMKKEEVVLNDLIPESVLRRANRYLAGDNIDLANNYLTHRNQEILILVLRDFFQEYRDRFSVAQGLDTSKVLMGMGHSSGLSTVKTTQPNTTIPQAPVSYSDKYGPDVKVIDLDISPDSFELLSREVQIPEPKKKREPDIQIKNSQVKYLTFEDVLQVGYLEGKAYADNQELMQYLFYLENALIAKDINNAAKDRPNMSIKYEDKTGKMMGYMLAWEGRIDNEYVAQHAPEYQGQPALYIMDIAAEGKSPRAGAALVTSFVDLYKRNYVEKGNLLPVFAQARETTSFKLIKKRLDRFGKELGVQFELVELPPYKRGDDWMHPVIIKPVQS